LEWFLSHGWESGFGREMIYWPWNLCACIISGKPFP